MGLLGCLFGTILPHVGAKHFPARSKYNMSACMMGHQLIPPSLINSSLDLLTHNTISLNVLIQYMEHTFANLDSIHDLVGFTLRSILIDHNKGACVVHLSA